jgi:hypothetical protein
MARRFAHTREISEMGRIGNDTEMAPMQRVGQRLNRRKRGSQLVRKAIEIDWRTTARNDVGGRFRCKADTDRAPYALPGGTGLGRVVIGSCQSGAPRWFVSRCRGSTGRTSHRFEPERQSFPSTALQGQTCT